MAAAAVEDGWTAQSEVGHMLVEASVTEVGSSAEEEAVELVAASVEDCEDEREAETMAAALASDSLLLL